VNAALCGSGRATPPVHMYVCVIPGVYAGGVEGFKGELMLASPIIPQNSRFTPGNRSGRASRGRVGDGYRKIRAGGHSVTVECRTETREERGEVNSKAFAEQCVEDGRSRQGV
jgi:hypothetical protein